MCGLQEFKAVILYKTNFPTLNWIRLPHFFDILNIVLILTKFVNKVYLLSYNVCENPGFPARKAEPGPIEFLY